MTNQKSKYLDEIGVYLSSYGQNALELHHHTTVADASDLYKSTLNTVKRTAYNAHWGSSMEIELTGMEIHEMVGIVLAHTDKLVHLPVRNDDGTIATLARSYKVLNDRKQGLYLTHHRWSSTDKKQIMDGGNQFTRLVTATKRDNLVTHRNKALDTTL